jgi:hypothetical protein
MSIDLTNLCYYDKRNPDCSVDDEDIKDHKRSLLKKNKTCSCDNCFYGRSDLTEQLILQQEISYSEEEVGELVYNIIGEYAKQCNIIIEGSKINDLFKRFKKK